MVKEIQEGLCKAVNGIKIEITLQEQEQLVGELNGFLQWLEPLLAVDTSGVDHMLISHGVVNVTRTDEIQSTEPTDLQKAAPNFEDGFYLVPSIIE